LDIDSLSEFECPLELQRETGCKLHFLDEEGFSDDVEIDDDNEQPGRVKAIAEWLKRKSLPAVFVVVILAIGATIFGDFDTRDNSNQEDDRVTSIGPISCDDLPEIPADIAERPNADALSDMRRYPIKFVGCGLGPRVLKWLREAADKGNAEAARAIGDIYNPDLREATEANHEPPPSSNSAYAYYRKSYELGDKLASCRLFELKKQIEKRAASSDREAVTLLRTWPVDLAASCTSQ
tara:strand:+ start:14004 stop:14714 length:711 start_codon:yes stop_codon:yes gene_type:complete